MEHFDRKRGQSNYTFRKLMALFLTCLNYTVIPLRLATVLGSLFALGGFVGAAIVFVRKLIEPAIPVGWSSVMCGMFAFGGIILLTLGIIGEYIGKIILNISGTPQYVIRETLNTGSVQK